MKRIIQVALISLSLGALSACSTVTPEQLSQLESKLMSEARGASSKAQQAMTAAEAAQSAADAAAAAAAEAKSTAEAAMSCCNENKDRIERMFEQTMKK
ncbi:MAG: Lpp/OprI family alanine-zipper lipoprotein [Pseudomonadota bacterium]